MKEKQNISKKNLMSKIALIFAIILIIFVGIISYTHTLMNTGKIYKNIFINGVDVSNLSISEARVLLEDNFKFGTLTLKNGENEWNQSLSELGFSYDIETAVKKAYDIGRKGSFVTDAIKVFSLHSGAEEFIELSSNEDYSKLDEFYNTVSSAIHSDPVNASISVNSGAVSIIPSKDGQIVDMEKLRQDVETAIKSSEEKSLTLDVPVKVTRAYVQTQDLSSINGVIATYTSKYSMKEQERSFNVALAAEKLNNQLLMPGDEVSFLGLLGDVSTSNGFRAAKIIINNEYQDGIGGGVCQVSSTLYNALLLGGMDITQRVNHSFPIGYVPIGRDATVATNGPDLKYKNGYEFPVFIKTYAYNGVMTAQVYGDTTRNKNVEIYSEVTGTVEPTLVYKNDPMLPLGKEEIEDPGHTGYTSVTYKIVDGKKTVISRDKYVMTPKIIKTGIGPALVPEQNTPAVEQVLSPDGQNTEESIVF